VPQSENEGVIVEHVNGHGMDDSCIATGHTSLVVWKPRVINFD